MKDGLIDEAHRKELLRFLLVKTAAVRCGVKPGELLRVRHCYEDRNDQGLRICLNRRDIYFCLKLDYIELRVEEGSSLILFYNPEKLARTLSERRNRYWLAKVGYGLDGTMDDYLRQDDWMAKLDEVKGLWAGKKVAVFGLGDKVGFADTFCAAADVLAATAQEVGATVIGDVVRIDEANESDQTEKRVADLVSCITNKM